MYTISKVHNKIRPNNVMFYEAETVTLRSKLGYTEDNGIDFHDGKKLKALLHDTGFSFKKFFSR